MAGAGVVGGVGGAGAAGAGGVGCDGNQVPVAIKPSKCMLESTN